MMFVLSLKQRPDDGCILEPNLTQASNHLDLGAVTNQDLTADQCVAVFIPRQITDYNNHMEHDFWRSVDDGSITQNPNR